MSLRYEVEEQILHFTFEAGTETEEIYGAVHRAYTDPNCPRNASVLFDLTASTSMASRSVEGIRTLSQFMLGHPDRPGRRIAIVVNSAEFERTEMLATSLAEETGLEIKLFAEEASARDWLLPR